MRTWVATKNVLSCTAKKKPMTGKNSVSKLVTRWRYITQVTPWYHGQPFTNKVTDQYLTNTFIHVY